MSSTAGGDDALRLGYRTRELTLPGVMQRQAEKYGDKTLLHFVPDGRRFSFRDAAERMDKLAQAFAASGVGKGDTVAIMLENTPEYFLSLLGIWRCGAVAAPINVAAKADLLRYYLDLSDARMVLVGASLLPRVAAELPGLPKIHTLVVIEDAQEESKPPSSTTLAPGAIGYPEFLARAGDAPLPEVRFNDVAMLSFTSGTTGPSKASIYTHAAVLIQAIAYADEWGYREDDTYYVCLPFFHMNALRSSSLIALVVGGTVALARRFSASRFWQDVAQSRATTFNLLGSMLDILWKQEPGEHDRSHQARMCRSAPMPAFASEFEARFGLRLITTYGLSDFGTPVAFTLDDPVAKRGSCGKPQRGWQVRIADEDDFEMPVGSVGQILLRCEVPWATASGYHKMPEESIRSRRNGWFHTGDLGRVDAEGYLYFMGRGKDAIRRRGENISAWEVEQVLLRHPGVAEAAVYPVRADMSEDEVAASLVLKAGAQAQPEELVRFCAENMAYFMVPRYLHFTADLPRTLSQKIEKFKLRDEAGAGRIQFWDREAHGIVLKR